MGSFLIAGAPGAGKTTVGELFRDAGYSTIDTDHYPGFTDWVNKHTHEKVSPPSEGMSKEWLARHDYLWDETLLHELIDGTKDQKLIFYGSSSNQSRFLDLFDKVFLLEIDPESIVGRLKNREGNEYGKVQSEIDHVLEWYPAFQEDYKQRGVIAIDSTQPLKLVFEGISRHINA